MLLDLLGDDNAEVKLNVIEGLLKICKIIGPDILDTGIMQELSTLTTAPNWRVRM